MIKDEQSRHSLTAGVMLVLLMGPALAAPKRASTVLDWLAAKDDTIFFRSILARFPYWQQLLADPKFVGTVFVPLDSTLPKGLTATLASELGDLETSIIWDTYRREFFNWKCTWRALNQHFIIGKAVGRGDLVNGAKFETPIEYVRPYYPDPNYNRAVIVKNSTGTYVGSTYFIESTDPPLLYRVRGSSMVGRAVIHRVEQPMWAGCDDDGYYEFPEIFFPDDVRRNATTLAQMDYPLVTGPWRDFFQPTLTMLRPSDKAFADYFAANQAADRQPTSFEQLLGDKELTRAFINAHLVGGRRLWLWDFMNMGVLGQGQAQVSTMGGKAYNVTFVQDKVTGKHRLSLRAPGSTKTITLMSHGEPGGSLWAHHECETVVNCDYSMQTGSALEVDAVLF